MVILLIEKLGKIDLDKAIIKTGLLRKAKVTPRIINAEHSSDLFKIAFLDHAGEDVYKYKDVDAVVTIGDDTTLISSDILYRFNIPIIGITDGDLDKVVEDGFKADKSVIFELESGHDDIVGGEIFNEIFKGNFILELPKSKGNISDIKNSIIEILNNINCKYNIKDI